MLRALSLWVVVAAVLCSLFLCAWGANEGEDVLPSDVVVLSEAMFDEAVADGKPWLIDFYAPWCGHCKKLAPTWEELAHTVKGKVNVAKVDGTQNRELMSRFGVRGFPTVKLVQGNMVWDHKGARTVEGFVQLVEKASKENGRPLPKPPTAFEKWYERHFSGLRAVVVQKPEISMAVVLAAGLLLGIVLGRLSVSCKKTVEEKTEEKTEEKKEQ